MGSVSFRMACVAVLACLFFACGTADRPDQTNPKENDGTSYLDPMGYVGISGGSNEQPIQSAGASGSAVALNTGGSSDAGTGGVAGELSSAGTVGTGGAIIADGGSNEQPIQSAGASGSAVALNTGGSSDAGTGGVAGELSSAGTVSMGGTVSIGGSSEAGISGIAGVSGFVTAGASNPPEVIVTVIEQKIHVDYVIDHNFLVSEAIEKKLVKSDMGPSFSAIEFSVVNKPISVPVRVIEVVACQSRDTIEFIQLEQVSVLYDGIELLASSQADAQGCWKLTPTSEDEIFSVGTTSKMSVQGLIDMTGIDTANLTYYANLYNELGPYTVLSISSVLFSSTHSPELLMVKH